MRTSLAKHPTQSPATIERTAARAVCIGAMTISGIWISGLVAAAAAASTILGVGVAGATVVASILLAVPIALLYAHARNPPHTTAPHEWISALGSIGPVAFALALGGLVYGLVGGFLPMAVLATVLVVFLAPLASQPLVWAWSRPYRSVDHAAGVIALTTLATGTLHIATMVALVGIL